MLRNVDGGAGTGHVPGKAGTLAGRRKGWGPLAPGAMVAYQTFNTGPKAKELTIGKVLVNHRGPQPGIEELSPITQVPKPMEFRDRREEEPPVRISSVAKNSVRMKEAFHMIVQGRGGLHR